jgi:hypothetical protein
MIFRVHLSNFYSIRDPLDIDLTISEIVPENGERFAEIFSESKYRAPKVVSLWGPNATGKSNLLRALSFVSWFNQTSFNFPPNSALPCHFFNTDTKRNEPMEIGVEFSGPINLEGAPDIKAGPQCRYAYKLVLDKGPKSENKSIGATPGGFADSQPTNVKYEALFYWPPHASRRLKVFERDENGSVSYGRHFDLSGFEKPLKNILRPNASVISTLVQLKHKPSEVLRYLAGQVSSNILLELVQHQDHQWAQYYSQNSELLAALNREIQRLDLGIVEVKFDPPTQTQPFGRASFFHAGLAAPLPSSSESHGTRQFVAIFPIIAAALQNGGVAVIDELDSSIHPLILPEILRWFYDPKRNPKNAQIWFSCQNVSLLRELAKEEILFCEKDKEGVTTIFGLSSIKNIRRIDNYMSKYLGGTYGAVPHIG